MLYFKITRSWFASASTAPAVKIIYEVSGTSMSVMIIYNGWWKSFSFKHSKPSRLMRQNRCWFPKMADFFCCVGEQSQDSGSMTSTSPVFPVRALSDALEGLPKNALWLFASNFRYIKASNEINNRISLWTLVETEPLKIEIPDINAIVMPISLHKPPIHPALVRLLFFLQTER